MKVTCTECGGTGRCIHCHGTGVLAPVFWHEGSRGPGEGLRCSYCTRGDCTHCLGSGQVEVEETSGTNPTSARKIEPEGEEKEPFSPMFFG